MRSPSRLHLADACAVVVLIVCTVIAIALINRH